MTAQPRQVHLSQALQTVPLSTADRAALDAIISKIRDGDDLTSHLTKRVRIGYRPETNGKYDRRHDLDLLLIDFARVHRARKCVEPDEPDVRRPA